MHSHHGWDSLAQVIKKADMARSYIVQTEIGRHLRRNRRDLLHTNENFTMTTLSDSGHDDLEAVPQSNASTQAPLPSTSNPIRNQASPYKTRS